jgi:hypothetical protein
MQIPIRTSLAELTGDISVPQFIAHENLIAANLWFGPGGNITPLHYDHGHNMLVQVLGRKKVTLFDAKELYRMYPFSAISPSRHISRINIREPDMERFPKFAQADRFEGLLEPGDVLFIPIFWWHQLEGIDVNISVNFWWQTPFLERILSLQWGRLAAGTALGMIRRKLRHAFHTRS